MKQTNLPSGATSLLHVILVAKCFASPGHGSPNNAASGDGCPFGPFRGKLLGDGGTMQLALPTQSDSTTEVEFAALHELRAKALVHEPVGVPNDANATVAMVPPLGHSSLSCGAGNVPSPSAFHSPMSPHVPDGVLPLDGV